MTTLEELKHKRKAALIVFCTLGLAGVSQFGGAGGIWSSNLFRGTSFDSGGLGFIMKIISFLFLTVLLAIPLFIISLFQLIYFQIKINEIERSQQQSNNNPAGETNRRTNTIDIFNAMYYYRENNQVYGPLTIEDLAVLDIQANTPLAVNNSNNWKYAGDIPDLIDTLRYVRS